MDYALYASILPPKPHPMVDRFVPFWQLVYHGIILSNPFPPTCNYTIKDASTCSEAHVRGLETSVNGEVYKDSCVEFSFSFNKTAYYNLEMNCIGTPHLGGLPPSRILRRHPLRLTRSHLS